MELKPGYKRTELGTIPVDWQVIPIGTLGKFKNGLNKGSEAFGHGHPFINLMDVFGVSSIEPSDSFGLVDTNSADQATYDLKRGDVLFIRSSVKPSGVGLTAVVEQDLPHTVYSGFLIRFRDGDNLDIGFKRHCFYDGGFRNQVIAASSVSANTNINQDNLKKLLLAVPSTKAEQRAIAAALSDVDTLLTKLDQLIIKKRDLKKAAMQQLLNRQTRLPGFDGPWELKRLGDVGRFLKGRGVRKDESLSGVLRCIRYGEIYTQHNDYIKSFHSWISPEVAALAVRLKKDDLCFAGSGETKEEIGKCVAFVDEVEAYAGGDIVILRPIKSNSLFLGYYLNTKPVSTQKASLGQGDAVVHISATALANVQIVVPNLDEQTAIATVLSDMDAELSTLEARREKTSALKQGMMQELLTGRIRLV